MELCCLLYVVSRPRYKPGLPSFPVPQSQAFGSNLFHEGSRCGRGGCSGPGAACVGVGMLGHALGCLFHLRGLQAGTGGHCLGMAWKALSHQEFCCCYSICDMVAPSGKSCFLWTSFASPSCPACLPREAKPKSREAHAKIPTALCKVFPLSTSPNLPGTVTKESREQGAGTEMLSEMPALCVHPLNHTYICIYMKSLVLNIDVISV